MTLNFDFTLTLWGSREIILALYHCWSRWKKAMQAWFSCHLVSSNLWGSLSLNRCCISSLSSLNSSSAHHVNISWTLKNKNSIFFANTYMLSFLISQRDGNSWKLENWTNSTTRYILVKQTYSVNLLGGLRVENIWVAKLKRWPFDPKIKRLPTWLGQPLS